MTAEPGWLPAPVQAIANAATRAGLVPLVDLDDDQSVWLLLAGARLGLLAMIGPDPFLFLEETDPAPDGFGDCITLRGWDPILAWITAARPTTTKETDQP